MIKQVQLEQTSEATYDEIISSIKKVTLGRKFQDIQEACWRLASSLDRLAHPEEGHNIRSLPGTDIPAGLRYLARDIEQGKYPKTSSFTWVYGREIGNIGVAGACNDVAATNAVFDLNIGLHKILAAGCGHVD